MYLLIYAYIHMRKRRHAEKDIYTDTCTYTYAPSYTVAEGFQAVDFRICQDLRKALVMFL